MYYSLWAICPIEVLHICCSLCAICPIEVQHIYYSIAQFVLLKYYIYIILYVAICLIETHNPES